MEADVKRNAEISRADGRASMVIYPVMRLDLLADSPSLL